MSAVLFDVAQHHRGKYLEPHVYLMWKYLPTESKYALGTDRNLMQYPYLHTRCQHKIRSAVTRQRKFWSF